MRPRTIWLAASCAAVAATALVTIPLVSAATRAPAVEHRYGNRIHSTNGNGNLGNIQVTGAPPTTTPRTSGNAAACKLPATNAYLSVGFNLAGSYAPSVGTPRATMIFVDFSDAPANDSTTSLYNQLAGAPDWFRTASHGRLNLQINPVTARFYRMPQNSTAYNLARGLTYTTHQQYVQDAVNAAGRSVDFRGTDVLYVVPTRRATAISFSPTFVGAVTAADGTSIGKTVTFGQDMWSWGFKVLNHETGHTMGLPDLYAGSGGHQYVGGWDLMGLISGPSPDLFGWLKWRQHWIDDNQVACISNSGTSTATLTPLETAGGPKIAVVKVSNARAIVAELRTNRSVDIATCATGVLIYNIDTTVDTLNGPIRVRDARPNSGGCGGNELDDAPYGYGTGAVTQFRDASTAITITVTGRTEDNNYTLKITK